MADPEKDPKKSSGWDWDSFWRSPGMPFFFVGLTFVFIGIGNVTFLILGITFMAIAFAMSDEGKKEPTADAEDPSTGKDQSDDGPERRNQ